MDKQSVDTRRKIVAAGQVPPAATLVTGYFDVLRVEHVRALQQVRDRTGDRPLVVALLPRQRELFHQRARAEMVAALRMVDYVLIANREGLDGILEGLRPAEFMRLEEAGLRHMHCLIEHVQRGQIR